MIRKAVSIAFFVLLFSNVTFSQPWHYDLGDSTRSFSTASTVSVTFMPIAPSGTARIRLDLQADHSIFRRAAPLSFGSDSYLRIAAPTTSSVNKFSVYDYTAGKLLTMKFKLRFGGTDGAASQPLMGHGRSLRATAIALPIIVDLPMRIVSWEFNLFSEIQGYNNKYAFRYKLANTWNSGLDHSAGNEF